MSDNLQRDTDVGRTLGISLELSDNGESTAWVSNGSDLSAIDFLSFATTRGLTPVWCNQETLESKLIDGTGNSSSSNERLNRASSASPAGAEGRVAKTIDHLIEQAIKSQSSDLHFEPYEDVLVCRNRIDGILTQVANIASEEKAESLSRIKIMAGLDIAEKRRPQDGRIRFSIEGRTVDIRVSVIPTDFGEKAVLRLLDKEHLRLDLGSLGFTSAQHKLFSEKITLPNGIILVTGPTGSGKTTTLYAALNYLNKSSTNISTVEDPIEYNLRGINQTQVKPEINLTFVAMLRALLRQDPNIIMVGEIRDAETLEIAIRASLTGHLVLSTLHTNSSIGTISRLIDMGGEPFLLSSSLKLIVAQRLIRKLCAACATSEVSEESRAATIQLGIDPTIVVRDAAGCDRCNNTGYAGRTAVYELLPVTDALRECISENGGEQKMGTIAAKSGFQSMTAQSAQLISSGITTPTEVLRELTS